MDLILLINCFALSISITVLMMCYEYIHCFKRAAGYFVICFITDMSFNLILPDFAYLTQSFLLMGLTVYMNITVKNFKRSILNTLTGLLVFNINILFFWSLLYLIGQNKVLLPTGLIYNLIFSCITIATSLVIRLIKKGKIIRFNLRSSKSILATDLCEFILFIFITLIFPVLPVSNDSFSYSLMVIFFVIIIVILYFTVSYIERLELKEFGLRLQKEFLEKEMKKYDEIIELKHYYLRLFKYCISYIEKGDKNGFNDSFEKYIKPLGYGIDEEENNKYSLSLIGSKLIQNLFFQVIYEMTTYPRIEFKVEIDYLILGSKIDEKDLFKILSIYFDNALEAVKKQETGFLYISIVNEENSCLLKIHNSACENKSAKDSFGVGLEIAKSIVAKYEDVNITTRILPDEYIQIVEIGGK